MLKKSEILSLFTPFMFIKEIADIQKNFEALSQESDAIILRNQLLSLKNKPFYQVLHPKKIEQLVELSLLYLAEYYPINHEDLFTLEPFNEGNYVNLTSGHRFETLSLFQYFEHLQFDKITNPFNREEIAACEIERILQTIEKKNPSLFLSFKNQLLKERYQCSQSFRQTLSYFENCSEHQIQQHLKDFFKSYLMFFPMMNMLLAEFIMLNYYTWFLSTSIPKIKLSDERLLILVNFSSLLFSETIFEWFFGKNKNQPLPFPYFLKQNLINCGSIIGIDLLLQFFSLSPFILSLREYLISYGSIFIALHIKYPKHHLDFSKYIDIAYVQMCFFILSNLMIKSYTQITHPNDHNNELNNLIKANLLFYLPHAVFFYFFISELKKISKELKETDDIHEEFPDILRNAI